MLFWLGIQESMETILPMDKCLCQHRLFKKKKETCDFEQLLKLMDCFRLRKTHKRLDDDGHFNTSEDVIYVVVSDTLNPFSLIEFLKTWSMLVFLHL